MGADDGWGPVERGEGGGGRAAAPSAPPREPVPRPDHDGFGPVQRGRARPVRIPRVRVGGRGLGRTLLLVVLVLLLLVAGTGAALAVFVSAQVNRVDVGGLGDAAGQMNVLIIGNDSRAGLTDEELQALGTEAVDGDRTDTIFLLSVAGGRAAMLSFPRDLFVTRCDGSQGRINVAYARGGPTCMVETVNQLSGIPVTHYVEVNFLGFITIVDAVGGVTLYFEEPFVDRPAGVDLPAGCQHLDGRRAIGYVRARTVDDDRGRIARQQRFIAELADEVSDPTTLLNPPRLFATARAAGQAVTASQNLGTFDLLRLARAARGFAGAGIATYTVPASPRMVGGAAVLVPDDAAAGSLFGQFRDGSILRPPPEPEAEAPEPAPPAEPAPQPDPGAAGAAPVPPDC